MRLRFGRVVIVVFIIGLFLRIGPLLEGVVTHLKAMDLLFDVIRLGLVVCVLHIFDPLFGVIDGLLHAAQSVSCQRAGR